MKKLFIPLLAGAALSCTWITAHGQEFKEHISKEFALSKESSGTVLSIYNIDGPIRVEGYSGSKVILEIDKTISADDNSKLETGKKEFKLGFDQTADTIIVYIAEPYDSRPHRHWHDRDNDREIEYEYHLDFTVKVPFGINLNISTVNNGDITVKDVAGTLHVNNVNGAISIANAKGTTSAHTINGNLTVSYLSNPPESCSFYTLNGKLTATFQSNLSADMQLKSMNGEFFTDFPNVEILPAKVTKNQEKQGGAIIYKLNKTTSVRIGSGGSLFKFETLNGNIYIKKQS